MTKICLVRPPALPAYHDTDIKEDPILCALIGYFNSICLAETEYDVFDFQLDRTVQFTTLLEKPYDYYVLVARDVGESYHYSLRLSALLSENTQANIFLYGQIAPLRFIKPLPERVCIVNQSEQALAAFLNISTTGAHFKKDLRYYSYLNKINLEDWQKTRQKGVIETTRGCPYFCKFCFINVGDSYETRWQIRPNDMIIADLKHYLHLGINRFVFLDSEFLGANKNHHRLREALLKTMVTELPPIKYMILCRADTLLAFNQFQLLKKSGLNKVLVGVESLYQPDLDLLKKHVRVETLKAGILQLIEHEIECCLTFLTFHSGTTLYGLKKNLDEIETLYHHPKAKYLGMPNFSFNIEVYRGEANNLETISPVTYLRPILHVRGQADASKVCFPAKLEPLIEIMRLLQYEWVVKKCELLREKVTATPAEISMIDVWFDNLGFFCIKQMRYLIDQFESGHLIFETLKKFNHYLYETYQLYNLVLPKRLQTVLTYQHAKEIDYLKDVTLEDHGWNEKIPFPKYALSSPLIIPSQRNSL